jgi:hypothetical protein
MVLFDSDQYSAVRRAQWGLKESVARFEASIPLAEVDRVFVAYVESLMWIVALDEMFRPIAKYQALKKSDPDGQIVRGLVWARHKSVHELAALHFRTSPASGVTVAGPKYPDGTYPIWLTSSEVRLRDQKVRGKADVENFDAHVAGRSIWSTLHSAKSFLFLHPFGDSVFQHENRIIPNAF